MRTIRVQLESQIDATTRLTLSTDARIALDSFIAGYAGEQL